MTDKATDAFQGNNANIADSFTSALGMLTKGFGASKNFGAQAQAQNFNQAVAKQNATAVGAQSATNTELLHQQQEAVIGRQEAGIGQANVGGPATGTNALAVRQSQMNAELQMLTEGYQGMVKKQGFVNQSNLDSYYSKVSSDNSTRSLIEGGEGALSELVRGSGRYSGNLLSPSTGYN